MSSVDAGSIVDLYPFKLIVVITDLGKKAEGSLRTLIDYAEREDSRRRHNFLFLDLGGIDTRLARRLPDGVSYTQCAANHDVVGEVISEHFRIAIPPSIYNKKAKPSDKSETLKELLDRLDIAADAISDLHLNSTSEAVSEIRSISQRLRVRIASKDQLITQGDVKNTVTEALMVIAKLFDAIENSKLAAIIVSGATTALMGCSGYSAAICVTVMLASWNGREAFVEAVSKLNPSKQVAKK
ncbi:hypothetical protein [Methylorubrum extorquens]|uniref:hypothetical protein n=1 Tax=Methylorubrum extorquens TaxID=408 RepID=UPI00209D53F5|nr:hypothetical protein [Methylorubrum extorquens]